MRQIAVRALQAGLRVIVRLCLYRARNATPPLHDGGIALIQEATARLKEGAEELLRLAAPAFAPPPFFDASLPPQAVKWPASLSENWKIEARVLAAVGTLMREWAKTELVFDGAMRQMANYPPLAATPEARQLKRYSFQAKAALWKKLHTSLFADDAEHLCLSAFVLSRAKQLNSARNEIAHWNAFPSQNSDLLVLVSTEPQAMWSEWDLDSLTAASVEIEHLRTALIAFTQFCLFRWVLTHSPALDVPSELRSDAGLHILRSYKARRSVSRPPRRRGFPPQP